MKYNSAMGVELPNRLLQAQHTLKHGGMVLRTMVLSGLSMPSDYIAGYPYSITITEEDWKSVMGTKISLKTALNDILACKIKFYDNCKGYFMLQEGQYDTKDKKIIMRLNNEFLKACLGVEIRSK